MLPSRNRGCSSVVVANPREKKGEAEAQEVRMVEFRGLQDREGERMRRDAMVGERN